MFNIPFSYDEPLFRPPSEAYSLIFQITIGCSWNKCTFCEMYTSKRFRVRGEEEIFKEIENAGKVFSDVRKIFLGDGNAMVLSFNKLMAVIQKLNSTFPKLNRISAYALPGDIISKSDQQLAELKAAGLKLLYVGVESGDDETLQKINKSESYQSTKKGLLKAKNAGIGLSVMIINGLGGKERSQEHAVESAKLMNEVQPEFLSTLVLSFPYGSAHFNNRYGTEFLPLDQMGLITEMKTFIGALELRNSIFRSDHASNYLVLKGTLSKDKEKLLSQIQSVISDPDNAFLRKEWMRGL